MPLYTAHITIHQQRDPNNPDGELEGGSVLVENSFEAPDGFAQRFCNDERVKVHSDELNDLMHKIKRGE